MTVPAERQRKLRLLSLYTGIGLHDCGLERTGAMRVVGQVEWDSYCSAVLEKHWPGLPRWADVRHVTTESIHDRCGRIDVITGGFSCKDVSVAGQGRGIGKETESGITWRNMFRLVRGLRPLGLIIENVPRLRTLAADRVLAALERIGYACWSVVVGAEHLGAPHRRHRVWIIGCLADAPRNRCEWGTVPILERRSRQADAHPLRAGEGSSELLADAKGEHGRQRKRYGICAEIEAGSEPRLEGSGVVPLADPISLDCGCGVQVPVGEAQGRTVVDRPGARFGICPARCFERMADATLGRLGTDRLAQRDTGHADECCEGMADASGAGLEVGRTCTGSAIAQQPVSAGGSGYRWPARPGEHQFDWEAPRLVQRKSQLSLGVSVDGCGPELVRAVADHFGFSLEKAQAWCAKNQFKIEGLQRRSALKALGNGNPPACAEIVGRAAIKLFTELSHG